MIIESRIHWERGRERKREGEREHEKRGDGENWWRGGKVEFGDVGSNKVLSMCGIRILD